ncbi:3'-5' exoribonuclease YhaM [Phycisphaerales bacterium]|nr:3'-5' exoribonuclease YhaM [Phycisphaerales bacterium]
MSSAPTKPAKPSLPPRIYIIDLAEPPQNVCGSYAIINKQLGTTRESRKYFLKCLIGDKTGQIPARMWTIDESTYSSLPTDGFVSIEGQTQAYQGEIQLIINRISPVDLNAEEIRDLLPASSRPPAEMFAELTGLLDTVRHPAMQALAKAYLDDAFLMDQFRQAPAAKSMHHAYLGGLLEHTLNLLKLADVVCPMYPKINRDIVIMGLFLHDLAKTRELVYDRAFSYTDRGELIGHIVDGAIMLHDKVQQVMREQGVRVPGNAILVLQHIIISHHGIPEYGAAKVPSTPEAILVSQLDNLDAKTTMALAAARPDRTSPIDAGGNFTEKQWALDTKIFKPDPLA